MPKTLTFNIDAQVSLRDGVDKLADAVKVTWSHVDELKSLIQNADDGSERERL